MPTKPKDERYEIDPADGLPREVVREWIIEKHQRLRHYIDISRAARRKFRGNSSFIDLYCGTGRARIKETDEIVPGSAVAAGTEAMRHEPFGKIFIADLHQSNVSACSARISKERLDHHESFSGPASETASKIVEKLNPFGLHFAFLDPYNLSAMPFSVIRELSRLKRMDLLIHFSIMDLQRNIRSLMRSGRLSEIAPGWEAHIDPSIRNDVAVNKLFQHWLQLVQGLGYKDSSNHTELVRGPNNQPLYRLVLASKNDMGKKFWKEVSNVGPQGRLFS